MIDARARQLLNAELDGELSVAERRELDALLAAAPGLAAEREALRGLARRLRDVPALDMPPDLTRRTLAGISLPARRNSRWRLPRWQLPAMALPLAAFASGLMVAAVALWSLPTGPMSSNSMEMLGTMVRSPAAGGMDTRGRLLLALEGVSGEVALASAAESGQALVFKLDSADPVDIEVDLAGTDLAFAGINQHQPGVELVATDGKTLQLRSQGTRSFTVFLATVAPRPAVGGIGIAFSGQRDGRQIELYRGAVALP